MLFNTKGKRIDPDKLPKGGKAREAALSALRELLAPEAGHRHGDMFKLGTRARLVN